MSKKRKENGPERTNQNIEDLPKEEVINLAKRRGKIIKGYRKNVEKLRKRLIGALTVGGLIGTGIGAAFSNQIKEGAGNFVSVARVASVFNPETGETKMGFVKERNKEDNTKTIGVVGENGEPEIITVDSGNVEEFGLMRLDDIIENIECKYIVPEGANAYLRTGEMKTDNNIVEKLYPGQTVYGSKPIYTSNGRYAKILDDNGNIYSLALDEIGEPTYTPDLYNDNAVKVVAKKDIKVYSDPDNKDKINAYIRKGTPVDVLKSTWEDPTGDSKIPVVKKIIQGDVAVTEGENIIGWVSKADLEELEINKLREQEKYNKARERFENTKFTLDGKVLGIDARDVSPEQLREMITNFKMPSSVEILDDDGNVIDVCDTSLYEGSNVGFVIIRIGASGYGENMTEIETNYKELVKVCEECNMPFGVYYYSTSTTIDEANIEADERIIPALKEIAAMGKIPSYIYIDAELSIDPEDRMLGMDVTDAKSHLLFRVDEAAKELFGKNVNIGIYTGTRETYGEEQILDLGEVYDVFNNRTIKLWLPNPKNSDGSTRQNDLADQYGDNIDITQVYQNAGINGDRWSFNVMDLPKYAEGMLGYSLGELTEERNSEDNKKTFAENVLDDVNSILGTTYSLKVPENEADILPIVSKDETQNKGDEGLVQ